VALVIITITDTPEGDLDISAKAEPFIPAPDSDQEPTPAQTAGLIAIAAIQSAVAGPEEVEQ
jgi:hypothetical protein